jgi:hypothetical protein
MRGAQTSRAYKNVTQFMRARFELASSEIRLTRERLSPAHFVNGYQRLAIINTDIHLITIDLLSPTLIQRHP